MFKCTLARRFFSPVSDFKRGLYRLCSHVNNVLLTENSHELVHMYTELIDHAIEHMVSHHHLTKKTWFNSTAVHV